MRLDTAEKRAAYRQCMIPKGATPDARNTDAGAVHHYEMVGKFYAVAFRGSAGKSEWHYCFRSAEQREHKAAEFFANIAAHQEYRAKVKAESAGVRPDVKVGDIFRSSWGYDQTNIDYYQCTALIGATMMEVREIDCHSEETAWAQGNSVPIPGAWSTEAYYGDEGEAYKREHGCYPRRAKKPMRVKIQGSNGEPFFKVASYANAYRMQPYAVIEGKPMFRESHWTAYA